MTPPSPEARELRDYLASDEYAARVEAARQERYAREQAERQEREHAAEQQKERAAP